MSFTKKLNDKFQQAALKWEPTRIFIKDVLEKAFDDSPVDRAWVQNIIDKVEDRKLTYIFAGTLTPIMSSMLWRASCNGFNDIIEHLSSKYTKKVAPMAGHSFWCASINGNLEGMKILMTHFKKDIAAKDIAEALNRACYQNNVPIVDYLLTNHGKDLGPHIDSALDSAAAFGCIETIEKLYTERKGDITLEGIDNAIQKAKGQQRFYMDKCDFGTTLKLLNQYKATHNIIRPAIIFKP